MARKWARIAQQLGGAARQLKDFATWMRGQLLLVGLLIILVVSACTGKSEITVQGVQYDEAQIEQGKQIYGQYCASCHGVNGEGQFPDAPLSPDETGRFGAPPHNGNGHTSHHPDGWLIRYIGEGGMSLRNPEIFYLMPAFGDQLSDEQISLIIAYIKTIWDER